MNACWNNVIRRIFGYHRWESVKAVIYALGTLNVIYNTKANPKVSKR